MNIGLASDQCGLPPKTIRYYEEINLLKPSRSQNGYRDYSPDEINILVFLKSARTLGFTIEECRSLLSLYQDKNRASADVKALALARISDIEEKISELQNLKNTLQNLAHNCQGDNRPDCPILDNLAKPGIAS